MPINDDDIIRLAATNVAQDITEGFKDSLRPDPHADPTFAPDLAGSGIANGKAIATSDDAVAVPWVYRCEHYADFLGVPATGKKIEMRGVTFVVMPSTKADTWTYARYIDYFGLLNQMGVSVISRPALTSEEYEVAYELHHI